MNEDHFSPLDLFHQQLALERIGVDSSNCLYRIPGENPDEMPRVMTARLSDGRYAAYFRNDLGRAELEELRRASPQELYHDEVRVKAVLGDSGTTWHGRTYLFTRPYPTYMSSLAKRYGARFVVEVDSRVVTEAWSSRSTDFAAELAVETQPEFRHRGYARQVCAMWATAQLGEGRVAFYSHGVANDASAALARSLGVTHFMDNRNYD